MAIGAARPGTASDEIGHTDLNVTGPASEAGHSSHLPQLLQITGALQTSLDITTVVQTFAREIGALLPHDSAHYRHDEHRIVIDTGNRARNVCSYQLVVCGERLGQMALTRSRKFSAADTALLEKLLCCLVYPLRNALLFRSAQQAALRDPLTGVNNRAAMDDALLRELDLARRHKTPLTLLTLDIDRFKQINDTHGHLNGDQVLKAVASTISDCMRSSDMLFRYGGEEFTVILSNTGTPGAALLAERIRNAVAARELTLNGRPISLTISIGLATADASDSRESLFNKADTALYRAKAAGRNRVVLHETSSRSE